MSCQILLNGLLSADVRDAVEVKVEANDSEYKKHLTGNMALTHAAYLSFDTLL